MNDDAAGGNDRMALAADISMTPLIDVMLVLLVVFMVTLPVLHHAAPQPEVRLSADHAARYDSIAKLLPAAPAAGVARVGFVTDPAAGR
ncbi:hypothetical protein AAB988_04615 [Burkholderia contaminans]|uniref:hypothetical protein n=1 Tax=Burkholderia contaminans TaxID=488447 RepID=UPI0031109DD7